MMYSVILLAAFAYRCCSGLDGFDSNCLKSHNEYRSKHGSPPLVWSESLAAQAQKWADYLAKTDSFKHDNASIKSYNQGENLAFFSPPRSKCMADKRDDCVQCSEMVANWYNEEKYYDFNTGESYGKEPISHFTQVVWKGTTELGVGTAISKGRYGFITVARYSPRGSIRSFDGFKKNVLPVGTPSRSNLPSSTPLPSKIPSGSASPSRPPSISTKRIPSASQFKNAAELFKPTQEDQCEYFIITTTTKEKKIIQKCKGKPNATYVLERSTEKPITQHFTIRQTTPTSLPTTTSTTESRTSKANTSPPTTLTPSTTESTTSTASVKSSPTTVPPTTSRPTTSRPTMEASKANTESSTTTASVTSSPTTASPTTSRATTDASAANIKSSTSTASPTTASPTTTQPTSAQPTTSQPTTAPPTTSQPTTGAHSAKPPTTAASTAASTATASPGTTAATSKASLGSQATASSAPSSIPSATARPGSAPLGDSSLEEQHKKAVVLINLYRALHNARPLVPSTQMTQEAQSWAEHLAETGQLAHDTTTRDGENIAKLKARSKDIENAIDFWYNEEKAYDFTKRDFSKATGHFTQLVWKSSREVGIGVAPSKDKSYYYIVVRFRPSGNIKWRFPENVEPETLLKH